MSEQLPQRMIRSYVLRAGRTTPGQQRALETLWQCYGLEPDTMPSDLTTVFARSAPVVLEIGFGNGTSLAAMAAAQPERDFIGIEVHRPGVGRLLQQIEQLSLTNLRVICSDAVTVLSQNIAAASLDRVQIYFPDPWPKKRHHKRRLIQPAFVKLLAEKLKPEGELHLATDWEHYAEQMHEVLENCDELINMAPDGGYCPRPPERALTKFEQRGTRLGHAVWDLCYRRR